MPSWGFLFRWNLFTHHFLDILSSWKSLYCLLLSRSQEGKALRLGCSPVRTPTISPFVLEWLFQGSIFSVPSFYMQTSHLFQTQSWNTRNRSALVLVYPQITTLMTSLVCDQLLRQATKQGSHWRFEATQQWGKWATSCFLLFISIHNLLPHRQNSIIDRLSACKMPYLPAGEPFMFEVLIPGCNKNTQSWEMMYGRRFIIGGHFAKKFLSCTSFFVSSSEVDLTAVHAWQGQQ